ncbi:elongation factor 1-delta isoform X2 [Alligator mississippiensis]|uniref:elongation factor 1-delta isoform X2 n=1 Tax=Alligator mississippiensis TaxID=8496 RepID=UPI002877BDF4|nr:elongation factor 1-delta isoform X2 [Alligator mississippiensis]
MRMRNLPYPAEKVWVDKHKYDEAERLHYEREATLAASAPERCPEVEVEVEAVNGVCHEDSSESDLKGDLKRARNGKKQKKRKRSPKAKSSVSKVDFVLTGLLADRVWFEKPFFDRAENAYRKKLADDFSRAASETELAVEPSALAPWAEAVQEVSTGRRNLAALLCTHGSLIACHHIIQDIWINKFDFDDAEKAFVERSQSFVPPHFLDLRSNSGTSNTGQRTPDEGYVTALPTPATPGLPADVAPAASFVSHLPSPGHQSVNGKPLMSSLQALMSEVWLEKPLYDDAEKCFYENMFDGHPPGKVRPQERGRPEALKQSRKDKKSGSIGKRAGVKRMEIAANSSLPRDAKQPSPTRFLLHEDSESLWLNKPAYDSAEARYYASEASRMASKEEEARVHECTLPKPSRLAPGASSSPATEIKEMAANFLMHEKIWFDKYKYDDAERRYYEQINGPVASSSCQQENGASTILRDIARARENIQKSLAGSASTTSAAGPSGDQSELISRISSLELENRNLRSVVADLQHAISKLESRLSTLERSSTSHQSSAPLPTQHVTPMKKVEPLSVSSKKVELPSAPPARKTAEPAAADEDEDDDDIDLFGSDDEEEDQEAAMVREERLRQYAEKKSKKPGLIAKSSILLDVKPWDDETDMAKMEECVRSVQMDGLVWGASKLVPVGYGIKKLQIQCVVEDDKVGTDILEEEITKFEDYVQSVDIAAFNKI